jgi:hypothetical protein
MKKLMLALLLTLLIVAVVASTALAEGNGVSATGLGRCTRADHGPGNGAAGHIWVPATAWENHNGGESGLHFMTAP